MGIRSKALPMACTGPQEPTLCPPLMGGTSAPLDFLLVLPVGSYTEVRVPQFWGPPHVAPPHPPTAEEMPLLHEAPTLNPAPDIPSCSFLCSILLKCQRRRYLWRYVVTDRPSTETVLPPNLFLARSLVYRRRSRISVESKCALWQQVSVPQFLHL